MTPNGLTDFNKLNPTVMDHYTQYSTAFVHCAGPGVSSPVPGGLLAKFGSSPDETQLKQDLNSDLQEQDGCVGSGLELGSAGGPPGAGLDTPGLEKIAIYIYQDSMLNVYFCH